MTDRQACLENVEYWTKAARELEAKGDHKLAARATGNALGWATQAKYAPDAVFYAV